MKKIISITLIVILLTVNCGCFYKNSDLNDLNIEYLSVSDLNYVSFNNVEDMYNHCDYVVIASPTENFTDSKQIWCNGSNETVTDFNEIHPSYSYTERNFKINKVLKGENPNLKEITVCERAYSNNDTVYVREGNYITEKNNKYLLFLTESNTKEKYFTGFFQRIYYLNSSDNENNKHINQQLYKQVKELYKSEFNN